MTNEYLVGQRDERPWGTWEIMATARDETFQHQPCHREIIEQHMAGIYKDHHKSLDTLRGYVRRVDLFKEHAGAAFL